MYVPVCREVYQHVDMPPMAVLHLQLTSNSKPIILMVNQPISSIPIQPITQPLVIKQDLPLALTWHYGNGFRLVNLGFKIAD